VTDEEGVAKQDRADEIPAQWWLRLGHDLRAPIAPMRLALQLLRSAQGSAAERQETLAALDRQLDHLLANINDLSDLARINAGTFALNIAPADLNLVIDIVEGRQALSSRFSERQQSLRCISSDNAIIARHDSARLAALLEFLLERAARHADAGTTLTLKLDESEDSRVARLRIAGAKNVLVADPELAYVAGTGTLAMIEMEARPIVMRRVVCLHQIIIERPSESSEIVLALPVSALPEP
jgi:signal transduction histidine kinase